MALKMGVKQEVFAYLTKQQGLMQELGMVSYSDYDMWFEALSAMEKIDIVIATINNLERLDPMLDSISYETESAQVVEEYTVAKFSQGNWDVAGKAYKPVLQDLNIPYDDYSCGVAISEKMALKDEQGTINRTLDAIVPAYRRMLRGMALKALLILPTDESKYTPCFWRDSSGFTKPEDKLAPHQNGLLKFTTEESHYLGEAAYSAGMLKKLEKKVRSKGYGDTLVIVASDSTWDKLEDAYTADDLKKIELVSITDEFAPKFGQVTYIRMPDTDFPTDYFLAYDPTVAILAHKISDSPKLQGLQRMFSTFEEARTAHRADFKVFENGMGVVQKGAGAVMYVGNAEYKNPNLSAL